MKKSIVVSTHSGYGCQINPGARFVVGVHERDQGSTTVGCQPVAQLTEIGIPLSVQRQIVNLNPRLLLQIIERVQHTVVFCFGRNNTLNTQITHSALQRHVIGFCPTRSKEDLADRGIQLVGYLLAGTFYSSPGLSSFRMNRGRVAKIALHCL